MLEAFFCGVEESVEASNEHFCYTELTARSAVMFGHRSGIPPNQ
jgi:hypothetical protein